MGTNLYKILNMVTGNKELCRLLKYPMPNIYDQSLPTDDECLELMGKNILLVPKIPEIDKVEGSFLVVLFESFDTQEKNNEFILTGITFDVLCPHRDWLISGESLRPFLMMAEISEMFHKQRMNNVGILNFEKAERFSLSPDLSGYTMLFSIHDFN